MRVRQVITAFMLAMAAPISVQASDLDTLYTSLAHCYRANAVLLEPHQNNMLDLAQILFDVTCEEDRADYFEFQHERGLMEVARYGAQHLTKEMVLSARASRLGIELN